LSVVHLTRFETRHSLMSTPGFKPQASCRLDAETSSTFGWSTSRRSESRCFPSSSSANVRGDQACRLAKVKLLDRLPATLSRYSNTSLNVEVYADEKEATRTYPDGFVTKDSRKVVSLSSSFGPSPFPGIQEDRQEGILGMFNFNCRRARPPMSKPRTSHVKLHSAADRREG
jgi:hypothetical protein